MVNLSVRKGFAYSLIGVVVVALLLFVIPIFNPQFSVVSQYRVLAVLLVWVPLAVIQMIVRGVFEASESFISAAVFRAYNQSVLFLVPWVMASWGHHDIFQIVLVITVARVLSLFPSFYWLMRQYSLELIKKIEDALERLNDDDFGYCEACGIDIGLRRLEVRPTATLCIDCKTLSEIKERQNQGS